MVVPKKQILVVDDEPLVLRSVTLLLLSAGYSVEAVTSGPDALACVEQGDFDLVVTDWKMPLMQGDCVAREIRKRQPHVPILLLTGSILETPPAGFDAVVYKPFSSEGLRQVVSSLVNRSA